MSTRDSRGSVAHGLEITARVITCAALIMVSDVAAFIGRHAWWLPSWLDRALPHLDAEGRAQEAATP